MNLTNLFNDLLLLILCFVSFLITIKLFSLLSELEQLDTGLVPRKTPVPIIRKDVLADRLLYYAQVNGYPTLSELEEILEINPYIRLEGGGFVFLAEADVNGRIQSCVPKGYKAADVIGFWTDGKTALAFFYDACFRKASGYRRAES